MGRAQVADLVRDVQEATAESVAMAYVDQGYTAKMLRRPRRRASNWSW